MVKNAGGKPTRVCGLCFKAVAKHQIRQIRFAHLPPSEAFILVREYHSNNEGYICPPQANDYTPTASQLARLFRFDYQEDMPSPIPRLHAEAAALGRDHLGLPCEEALTPSAAYAVDALARWNQNAEDSGRKVLERISTDPKWS